MTSYAGRVTEVYEWLREANPHLPEIKDVAKEVVSIDFDPMGFSKITFSMFIDLPTKPGPWRETDE